MLSIGLRKLSVLQSAQTFNRVSVMPSWASLTVEEAAKETGYNEQHIRRLIRTKKIEAVKFGSLYLIKQESLRAYVKQVSQENDGRYGPHKRS